MSQRKPPSSRNDRATMPPTAAAKEIVQVERASTSYLLLRRPQGDVRLNVGPALIGRGTSCDVVINHPMVSRSHARLTVGSDSAVVEDLGSQNGVYVNGGRIAGKRTLRHGDVLRVGRDDLQLLFFDEEEAEPRRREVKTVQRPMIDELVEDGAVRDESPTAPTLEVDGLEGLADQILSQGGSDEAERMLSTQMGDMLKRARAGDLEPELRHTAATFAARLAAATEKGKWIDYAIELHALAAVPPSNEVVDLLEAAVSLVDSFDVDAMGTYVRNLRSMEDRFSDAERALIDRIEELSHSAGWG